HSREPPGATGSYGDYRDGSGRIRPPPGDVSAYGEGHGSRANHAGTADLGRAARTDRRFLRSDRFPGEEPGTGSRRGQTALARTGPDAPSAQISRPSRTQPASRCQERKRMSTDLQTLTHQFQFNNGIYARTVAGIPPEQWLIQPSEESNHLLWV